MCIGCWGVCYEVPWSLLLPLTVLVLSCVSWCWLAVLLVAAGILGRYPQGEVNREWEFYLECYGLSLSLLGNRLYIRPRTGLFDWLCAAFVGRF